MATTGRDSDKVIIRLPDGMRDRIKAAAVRNNRSMNAEIVATLEKTYKAVERRTMEWFESLPLKAQHDIIKRYHVQFSFAEDDEGMAVILIPRKAGEEFAPE